MSTTKMQDRKAGKVISPEELVKEAEKAVPVVRETRERYSRFFAAAEVLFARGFSPEGAADWIVEQGHVKPSLRYNFRRSLARFAAKRKEGKA